jgi:hypothetical protein
MFQTSRGEGRQEQLYWMGRLATNQNGTLKKTILKLHSKKEWTVNLEQHDCFNLFISTVITTTDTTLGPNQ